VSKADAFSSATAQSRFRTRKPWSQLQHSARWNRRKEAVDACHRIGIPPTEVIANAGRLRVGTVLHLRRSIRDKLRTIPHLRLPAEQTIRRCKELLARVVGTRTESFVLQGKHGAYVTDPVHLVAALRGSSPFLCVGGDKGSQFTKLGVTFINAANKAHFAAVVIYEGNDSLEWLCLLQDPSALAFEGDTSAAHHTNIYAYFQQLINQGAFLNGDWKFISAVLALMGPAASYPCPKCVVSKQRFRMIDEPRDSSINSALQNSGALAVPPLLKIKADHIVPTPLHVYQGIGNRILDNMLVRAFKKPRVDEEIAKLKSIHAPGNGGKSDLYKLNGVELSRFIKKETILNMVKATPDLEQGLKSRLITAHHFLFGISRFLLKSGYWHPEEIFLFKKLVQHIVKQWHFVTRDHLFPKMHMLLHCAEFAEQWKFLGSAAESQIESSHAEFNRYYNVSHINKAKDPAVRVKRSLSDHIVQTSTRTALGDVTNLISHQPTRNYTI